MINLISKPASKIDRSNLVIWFSNASSFINEKFKARLLAHFDTISYKEYSNFHHVLTEPTISDACIV